MKLDANVLDLLHREKVAAAQRMTAEQRVLAAFELTEFVWQNIQDGVRDQHPGASDEEVRHLACERVAVVRRLDERR